MSYAPKSKALLLVVLVLVMLSLACMSSGSSPDSNQADSGSAELAATAAVLQATQDALDLQAQAQPPTQEPAVVEEPPIENEPVDVPPAQSSGGGEIDFNNLKSGDLYYATDFNGIDNQWENGWVHFPIPDGKNNYDAIMVDGYLHLGLYDTGTTVYLFYEPLYLPRGNADVLVEASADNVGDVRNNNISVICRATDRGWYEFSIASNGLWWIWKYDGIESTYDILAKGGVPNYNKNITDHIISATCIGSELTFYYDTKPLKYGQISDSTFKEGQVGVAVYAENLPGVEVEFDWFEAQVP